MLSISHAATGAFIAAKLQNPWLFIPATLMSHYLEDWILHWDVGTGLTNGTRKRVDAFKFELIDLALAGGFVWLMYPIDLVDAGRQFFTGHWGELLPYFGAFFGLLPDFIEAPRNFLKWNPWFLKPLNAFHHAVHRSTPNIIVGLTPQIVLLALLLVFK